MPVALSEIGPFSVDTYVLDSTTSADSISARTFTLTKAAFDPALSETLEITINAVKLLGDGTKTVAASGHEFYVNSATNPTSVTIETNARLNSITDSTITTLAVDDVLKLKRISNRTTKNVDYSPGSVIREADLDNSNTQIMHVAQEAIDVAYNGIQLDGDNKFSARESGGTTDRVLKNLGAGSADTDAVNYGQFATHDTTITGYRDTTNDYKLEAKDWAQLITSQVKAYSDGSVTGSFIEDSAKNWASGITSAAPSAGSAKEWAIGGEATVGTAVAGGEYSAKKHAQDASTSAGEALESKTAAAASEAAANASADAVSSIIDNFYDKYLGAMADTAAQGTNPTPTGEWAKDSSTITVSANTNIKVGQVVTGHSSIPAGANVLSIDSTSIVISANMTAASPETDPTLAFTGYGVYGTFNSTKDGPATDNDGDALADGMLYFNTTDDVMMVYDVTSTKWKQLQPTTSEMTAIQTCHTNIGTINDFADKYRIAGSAPGSDNDEGDLYYNTTDNKVRYYDGSSWTAFGLNEAQTQTEANNASVAMSIALG